MRTRERHPEWGWWCVATVTLVGGSWCLTQGGIPPSAQVQVLSVATTPRPVLRAFAPRSLPRLVQIPSLGVVAHVSPLGLQPNGTVMVPKTVTGVGWYRYGPTPGQLGSSVLLGHVDSYRGPGVFIYLKRLRAGAAIYVGLANGRTAVFRVRRVVRYAKDAFPDALIYTRVGPPELTLVTCGGQFDFSTRSYESNVVVFSDYRGLVSVVP